MDTHAHTRDTGTARNTCMHQSELSGLCRQNMGMARSINVKAMSPAASPVSLFPRSVMFHGVIRIKRIEYAPGDPGTATDPVGGGKEQFVEHHSAQEVHSEATFALAIFNNF